MKILPKFELLVLEAFLRANLEGSFAMFGWRWGWDIWEDTVIGMRKKCKDRRLRSLKKDIHPFLPRCTSPLPLSWMTSFMNPLIPESLTLESSPWYPVHLGEQARHSSAPQAGNPDAASLAGMCWKFPRLLPFLV